VIDAALVTKTAAAAADFTTSLDTIPKINSYAGDAAAAAARDLLKQVDSTTDLTAFQCVAQRCRFDQGSPRRVNDEHAALGPGETRPVEDVVSDLRQRGMKRNDVGFGEQVIER